MNKKVNILNIIISVLLLSLFVYGLITKGQDYSSTYGAKFLYIGSGVNIIMLLLSLFKIIRDGVWMDVIFMIYLLMFIFFNFYAQIYGMNLNIYGLFIWYPIWIKYLLIVLLIINILFFILSFMEVKESE